MQTIESIGGPGFRLVTNLESSQIEAFAYDPANDILHVLFKGGSAYEYDGVFEGAAQVLLTSPSIGRDFNTQIKAVGYAYRKLEPEDPASCGVCVHGKQQHEECADCDSDHLDYLTDGSHIPTLAGGAQA